MTLQQLPSGCFCCACSWRSFPHSWSPTPAGRHTNTAERLSQKQTEIITKRSRRRHFSTQLGVIDGATLNTLSSDWPHRPGQLWWSSRPLEVQRAEQPCILLHHLSLLQIYRTLLLHSKKRSKTKLFKHRYFSELKISSIVLITSLNSARRPSTFKQS